MAWQWLVRAQCGDAPRRKSISQGMETDLDGRRKGPKFAAAAVVRGLQGLYHSLLVRPKLAHP
jgi:hypothetical protein